MKKNKIKFFKINKSNKLSRTKLKAKDIKENNINHLANIMLENEYVYDSLTIECNSDNK